LKTGRKGIVEMFRTYSYIFFNLLILLYYFFKVHHKNIFKGTPSETVKKLLSIKRAGRDIEKVLQRYIYSLTPQDEKL